MGGNPKQTLGCKSGGEFAARPAAVVHAIAKPTQQADVANVERCLQLRAQHLRGLTHEVATATFKSHFSTTPGPQQLQLRLRAQAVRSAIVHIREVLIGIISAGQNRAAFPRSLLVCARNAGAATGDIQLGEVSLKLCQALLIALIWASQSAAGPAGWLILTGGSCC